MGNENMTTGDDLVIEILTDLLGHNVIECEGVEVRTINGKSYIDLVRKNIDKDTTIHRFLKGTDTTLNRKSYSITRLNPADIIELDSYSLDYDDKGIMIIFMKLNNPDRKELNVAFSDRDSAQKLMNYLMPAW